MGTQAWSAILRQHPNFASLSWLAKRLNIEEQTARSLQHAGRGLRLFVDRVGVNPNNIHIYVQR